MASRKSPTKIETEPTAKNAGGITLNAEQLQQIRQYLGAIVQPGAAHHPDPVQMYNAMIDQSKQLATEAADILSTAERGGA